MPMKNKMQYIYGKHAVTAVLQRNPRRIKRLYLHNYRKDLLAKRWHKMVMLAQKNKINIEKIATIL